MVTKDIYQEVTFRDATPHEVYELLMDSDRHASFSGQPAEISRKMGGEVLAYDGLIEAINTDLLPDMLISQKWREKDWPKGHYSQVTYEIIPASIGTRLTLTQIGVPAKEYEHVNASWRSMYWDKMRTALKGETVS